MSEGEPKSIDYKGKRVFTVCGCKGTVVTAEDGTKHIELECIDKEAREQMATILEQEAILRVNPKVVFEDIAPPGVEPVVEPVVEPQPVVEPVVEPVTEPGEEATHKPISNIAKQY